MPDPTAAKVIKVDSDIHQATKIICATMGRKIGDYANEALTEKNQREESAIKSLKRGNRRGGKAA